jgi:hypothetical protein
VRIISLLFTLFALAGVVEARESILSFPIPSANRELRARLYTDNLYEQDFKIDHKHILAEYFTGGDSNLLASFRQEFEMPLYINITAKPLMNNNLEDFQVTIHSYYKPYDWRVEGSGRQSSFRFEFQIGALECQPHPLVC